MEIKLCPPVAGRGWVLLVFCLLAGITAPAQSGSLPTNSVPPDLTTDTNVTGVRMTNSIPQEFWIGTNATGNLFTNVTHYSGGTSNYPFDGSTQTNFDFVMLNLPTNTTIHLLPGTFQTLGGIYTVSGWSAKPGQRILGSGVDVTILQHPAWQVTNHALMDYHYLIKATGSGSNSFCGNVDLEDFTADCNYHASNHVAGDYAVINAICLLGASNTVRNVKVINQAAYGTNISDYREAWGITIGLDSGSLNNGNLIAGCSFSNFTANYYCNADAFFMQNSGTILSNLVVQIGNNPIYAANIYGPGRIAGNQVYNCSIFDHMDNGSTWVTNVIIENNLIVNADNVLDLWNGRMDNILFRHNTIVLTNHPGNGHDANNFMPHTPSRPALTNFYNITLLGNTFTAASPGVSGWNFIHASGAVGLNVISNVVPASFGNAIVNSTNVIIQGNVDANGNYLGMNNVTNLLLTVTYDGNGNTAGAAPYDFHNPYLSGAGVIVQGNPVGLAQAGYVFSGWNAAADGSGTNYIPGKSPTSFVITSNTTLYALWGLPAPAGLQIITK